MFASHLTVYTRAGYVCRRKTETDALERSEGRGRDWRESEEDGRGEDMRERVCIRIRDISAFCERVKYHLYDRLGRVSLFLLRS